MGYSASQGRLTRVLAAAAAAALTIGTIAPAAASDPPASAAGKALAKKETRYCAYIAKAGAAPMEKICMVRGRWIKNYGVDPARFRK
jgi:hypothetical protein